jgi:hypothetical protein
VALDRSIGAGDRLATAFEVDLRGARGDVEARLVDDGVRALRPAAFPWTFRRRDALSALAAAACALFALAAPAEARRGTVEGREPRIVAEEGERLARTAAEAGAAAEDANSAAAVEAAKRAGALAGRMKDMGAGEAAAEIAREAAAVRALTAALRTKNPEAAKALERIADRLEAGGARVAAAGGPTDGPPAGAGTGALEPPPLPRGDPSTFSPLVPADPAALREAAWPAEYDGAVVYYFSEERR